MSRPAGWVILVLGAAVACIGYLGSARYPASLSAVPYLEKLLPFLVEGWREQRDLYAPIFESKLWVFVRSHPMEVAGGYGLIGLFLLLSRGYRDAGWEHCLLVLWYGLFNAVFVTGAGISIHFLYTAELYSLLVLPVAVVIGAPVLGYLYERKREVVALLMEVHEKLEVPSATDLRCAVFIPCSRRKALKEYVRYANPKEHRQKCKMLISQGVAGRCYRTKELCNVPIMKGTFSDQHVRELGFVIGKHHEDPEGKILVRLPGGTQGVIPQEPLKPMECTCDRVP